MVSTVSPQVPFPLQASHDIIWNCERINSESRYPLRDYSQMIELFHSAIRNLQNANDLFVITRNLFIIQNLMPRDLQAIHQRIYNLAYILSTIYLVVMFCYLDSVKSKIGASWDFSELDTLKREIDKVEQYNKALPFANFPEWKKLISQCHKLYHSKASLVNFTQSPSRELSPPRSIFPILAIDGGGERGIIPLKILAAIEKITGKPIASLFKLIGGTSTGGIVSLGLTKPDIVEPWRPQYSAQDMLHIYTHEHDRIFFKNSPPKMPLGLNIAQQIQWKITNSLYVDPAPFFAEKFGTTTLSSSLTDVLITTNSLQAVLFNQKVHYFTKDGLKYVKYRFSDLENSCSWIYDYPSRPSSHPFFIRNAYQYDFPMSLAAKATSAAPTFFPLVEWGSDKLIDGGVLQNNPALPCVMEALNRGVRREDLLLLSVGTGEGPEGYVPEEAGAALFSIWNEIIQPQHKTESSLNQMLRYGAYHRFQHQFSEKVPEMDDVTAGTIQLLENAGDQLVEENYDLLRSLCKVLAPDNIVD